MQLQNRQHATTERPSTWLTLAKVGAAGFVIWALTIQLGSGFLDPIVTSLAVIYAASIGLIDPGHRGRVVAFTVFASSTMVPNLVFGGPDFTHLDSAGSFVPQLFVTLSIVLAIVGGVGELRQWSTDIVRTVLGRSAAVLAVGVAVSLVVSATAPSDDPLVGDVVVDADGFAWAPGVVTYDASEASGLWIDNRDFAHHTFAVPNLGIEIQLPASKSRRVELGDVAAGEYQFRCTIPGHENMTGTLIVTG
jgi:plastocyanin